MTDKFGLADHLPGLVMLPHESQGCRARESVMHLAWEMTTWVDKYINTTAPTDVRSSQNGRPEGRPLRESRTVFYSLSTQSRPREVSAR